MLIIEFSACGGIHTVRRVPVLTAYFPLKWLRASWESVDCSWHHHYRRLPYWAPGLFYPSWNRLTGCTEL